MKIYIGYDEREKEAYDVCKFSIESRASDLVEIVPLKLQALRQMGKYHRTFEAHDGVRYDDLDRMPFSTEFAFSRFLVPNLNNYQGWALFMDCDMLLQADISELFALADEKYAVMCVKHDHEPDETEKMDGQIQQRYFRKNWSSFMLFNCGHEGNRFLSERLVNTATGGHLHAFGWLADDEIGSLPEEWNWLEGHSDPGIEPKNIHYTRGGPWFDDYGDVQYAKEWLDERDAMQGVKVAV